MFICPSATNVTVNPTTSNPYFCYALNLCSHKSGATHTIFKRDEMTAPSSTIVFCEGELKTISVRPAGRYVGAKHNGGGNFCFQETAIISEWLPFCQLLPAGQLRDAAVLAARSLGPTRRLPGDAGTRAVAYHWWFFKGRAEIANN